MRFGATRRLLMLICGGAFCLAAPAAEPPAGLPRPFGVGITLYGQSQDYSLERLSFDLPGLAVDTGAIAIDNQLAEQNLKLDYWLLPFLNVFAIAGRLEGQTDVDFSAVPLPVPLSRVSIQYDGEVYGGGVTFAIGGERWFGSLTGIYTDTEVSGDFDSSVTALVVTPKVGLHGDRGAFWVGAMYQEAEEEHAGTISLPFLGSVGFDVKLAEEDSINLLFGMSAGITEHLHVELEGGTVGRLSGSVGLTWRF